MERESRVASGLVADDWEERVAACWRRFRTGELPEDELVPTIDVLAAERPADDPAAAYERASARDSVGIEDEAEPLYRAALAGALDGRRRLQATIQLASTLRLLGRLDESERLLRGAARGGRRCLTRHGPSSRSPSPPQAGRGRPSRTR